VLDFFKEEGEDKCKEEQTGWEEDKAEHCPHGVPEDEYEALGKAKRSQPQTRRKRKTSAQPRMMNLPTSPDSFAILSPCLSLKI
jgi:hypothetical protein